jgi:hypothetical protein
LPVFAGFLHLHFFAQNAHFLHISSISRKNRLENRSKKITPNEIALFRTPISEFFAIVFRPVWNLEFGTSSPSLPLHSRIEIVLHRFAL